MRLEGNDRKRKTIRKQVNNYLQITQEQSMGLTFSSNLWNNLYAHRSFNDVPRCIAVFATERKGERKVKTGRTGKRNERKEKGKK
jgi:hypothetical protein